MLSRAFTFSPEQDENFFEQVPAAAAVFLLRGEGEPYVSKTANLRKRLQRLLGIPAEQSKRLNLRERVREIQFTCTGSDFESSLLLYQTLRANFPETYAKRLRLRPAPMVKLHLENEYPRASVTTRFSARSANLYYGPFPSRVAAEKFANDVLDFFKMRRCVDDLHPDPSFPGCVYSEMKMCLAPCFKGCTDDEYQGEVSRVRNFFDSGGESLRRELNGERERASSELAFEEAAEVHAQIEKLKPVLAQLPEIVRRIDRLDAIVIQPSAEAGSVCLFRFQNAELTGPVSFRIEQRGETVSSPIEPSSPAKPRSMESRVEKAMALFPELKREPGEPVEHLAMLKRWYYRSHRVGEFFLADNVGSWPLRRMVRGIGRVYHGECHQADISFSAPQTGSPPSQLL